MNWKNKFINFKVGDRARYIRFVGGALVDIPLGLVGTIVSEKKLDSSGYSGWSIQYDDVRYKDREIVAFEGELEYYEPTIYPPGWFS